MPGIDTLAPERTDRSSGFLDLLLFASTLAPMSARFFFDLVPKRIGKTAGALKFWPQRRRQNQRWRHWRKPTLRHLTQPSPFCPSSAGSGRRGRSTGQKQHHVVVHDLTYRFSRISPSSSGTPFFALPAALKARLRDRFRHRRRRFHPTSRAAPAGRVHLPVVQDRRDTFRRQDVFDDHLREHAIAGTEKSPTCKSTSGSSAGDAESTVGLLVRERLCDMYKRS